MLRLISGWQCPKSPLPTLGVPPTLTTCLWPQQMDDAVYTFETLLHQELGKLQGKDDLCKSIQRILERVLKVRQGVRTFGGLWWPCSLAREEARSDVVYFNKSLPGKFFFILRFSWILLGEGKWEITWRSQVPSDHSCKSPPGFRLAPKPSCSHQWLLPGLRNTRKQLGRGM